MSVELGRWLDSCGRDGRPPSRHTCRSYLAAFRAFGAWLSDSADEAEQSRAVAALVLSKDHAAASRLLRTWREELLASGASAGTVNARLGGVRSLFAWARRCGLTTFRPEGLSVTWERRHDRRGPTTPEVVAMLAACGTDPVGRRDAFAIRLGRNLGLRVSEIVGLRLEDIGDGELRVLGKGRRERVSVAMDPATARSLTAWLEARGDAPGPLLTRLDVNAADVAPMSAEALRRMIARRARQAGIERAVRPHGLRHSGATAVAKQLGMDSRVVAWGRWSSAAGAAWYIHGWSKDGDARDVAI